MVLQKYLVEREGQRFQSLFPNLRLQLTFPDGDGVPAHRSQFNINLVTAFSVIVREPKDDNTANVGKDDPKEDPKELSERQELIIGLIKDNDLITIQQMTQKTKVSEKTIKRELATLQEKGILTREGGRKEGKWVIIVK